MLQSLFSGEAKNRFGVPYARLGVAVNCGLVVTQLLGPIAKPLEHHLARILDDGNGVYAAAALRSLGSLNDASVAALAAKLDGNILVALEAATALVACGAGGDQAVRAARDASARAADCLQKAERRLGVS